MQNEVQIDTNQTSQLSTIVQDSNPFLRDSNENNTTPAGVYKRLMIAKIELTNFKSYFGKKVIGPLHKNFTAVVGPNGSGKSNCIESLLFVFGKRAKQMRLSKLSELIHKSAEHGDCNSATVKVYFTDILDVEADADLYTEIEGSQFTVSRMVTRSSTSKYFLNDNAVDYKDVCQLLQEKGIDLEHNRFLILQGEVEQISLMKPKALNPNDTGLLEYLEEIIGSSAHVEEIESLAKQLEVENEKRIEQTNRVKASLSELSSLEEEQKYSMDYLLKERRFWKFLNFKNFIELSESVAQYNEHTSKFSSQRELLREKKEAKRVMFTENSVLVTDINNLHSQQEQAEKRHKELQRDFETLERADAVVNNEKKHKISEIAKCEKKVKELEEEKVQVAERNQQITLEMPELEQKAKQLQEQKASIQQRWDAEDMRVHEITVKLREERDEIERPLQRMQQQIKAIKIQIEGKKSEIEQIQGRKDKIAQEKEQLQSQINAQTSKFTNAQRVFQDNQEQYQTLSDELTTNAQREVQIVDQLKVIDRERQEMETKLSLMQSQIKKQQQGNAIILGLKEAQRQGLVSGFYGRLGDLGTIPKMYDVAITTSCGHLESMVVDTTTDAEKCIGFLREQKLGRANFICLDRITEVFSRHMNQQFQCPQNAQRLFELIVPNDPKFQIAFYFGIKDTLVCEGIETATGINKQQDEERKRRHRIVTTKGELVEIMGTISGGGKPKCGGMSAQRVIVYSEHDVKQLMQQVEQKRQEMDQIRHEARKISVSQNEGQRRIKDLKRATEISQVDVNAFKQQLDIYTRKFQNNQNEENKLESDNRRVEQLLDEIQNSSAQLMTLTPELEKQKTDLQKKMQQIMDVGGESYKQLKDELDQITKQVNESDRTLTRNRSTLSTSDQNVRKLDLDIKRMQEEISNLNRAKLLLNQDCEKNDKAGQELLTLMQACEQVKRDCETRLEVRKKDFGEMKKKIEEINQEEQKLKDQFEIICQQRDALKAKADKIKVSIKANRDKYKKSEEEFGTDYELQNGGNPPPRDSQIAGDFERPSQQESSIQQTQNERGTVSRISGIIVNPIGRQSQRPVMSQADQARGVEYFVEQRSVMHTYNDDEIKILVHQKAQIDSQITGLKQIMDTTNPNVQIIAQYRNKKRDHEVKVQDLRTLENNLTEHKQKHETLKLNRHKQFRQGFDLIAKHVKQIYRLITNGGDADLETIDQLDPFSEGVLFQVRPKNKSWKHMSKLSGGEKTLSSLSLIFALHIFKPSPLYCMDEIDAALDYKNVAIVGKYIREGVCKQGAANEQHVQIAGQARASQFIIISLRNNMFELADKMVGIYKTHDVTQTITVNPKMILENIKNMLPVNEACEGPNKENQNPNGQVVEPMIE